MFNKAVMYSVCTLDLITCILLYSVIKFLLPGLAASNPLVRARVTRDYSTLLLHPEIYSR